MRVLILGIDGYIGYPLALHLIRKGHVVVGLDNGSRRRRVEALGCSSLTPILSMEDRHVYLRKMFGDYEGLHVMTLGNKDVNHTLFGLLGQFQPDTIVHLAEQPSAPWSMYSREWARETQLENVLGTLDLLWGMREYCPGAHLVKIGTMGEYGTPNCDIPEGVIPEGCLGEYTSHHPLFTKPYICPMKGLLFPRQPGSWYHLSKVHDTNNIAFACHNWGLRSTDIMQGIVFGLESINPTCDPRGKEELTRFDYDQFFGTAINRFCLQATIGHPLTVYGIGGQMRGFLPLKDSIQCLTLAIENPPESGRYRTLNQFENVYTILSLAHMVADAALKLGIEGVSVGHIENPRYEAEDHHYNPTHQALFDMGYEPTTDIRGEIRDLIEDILPYKDRVVKDMIMPTVKWR